MLDLQSTSRNGLFESQDQLEKQDNVVGEDLMKL